MANKYVDYLSFTEKDLRDLSLGKIIVNQSYEYFECRKILFKLIQYLLYKYSRQL